MLLAQIIKRLYCLLQTVVAGGKGQVEDIRDEVGRRFTWKKSKTPKGNGGRRY
jgi:hypothetical protein